MYACVGDDVVLDWQYSGSPVFVHWTFNKGVTNVASYLLNTFTPHAGYGNRVYWSGNGNITIRNVQTEDSGTYLCETTEDILDLSSYRSSEIQVYVYSKYISSICLFIHFTLILFSVLFRTQKLIFGDCF